MHLPAFSDIIAVSRPRIKRRIHIKRISCLVLTLLLALLCACGQTDTLPADDPPSADPVASLDDIPQVCRLYYTYADWSPIAPTDSKLPLAASASRGAPDYIPV